MKQIYFSNTVAEAHFVKGLLANEGVHAEVHGEFQSGALGGVPMTERPSVWVNDEDEEIGTKIVDAYIRSHDPEEREKAGGAGEPEDGEGGGGGGDPSP